MSRPTPFDDPATKAAWEAHLAANRRAARHYQVLPLAHNRGAIRLCVCGRPAYLTYGVCRGCLAWEESA